VGPTGATCGPMDLGALPAVRRVERACFDDVWTPAGWREELARDDRRWRTVRASPDDGVVGFGGLWLAPDAAHVMRVAVVPASRGRGLGARLIDDLLAVAAREDHPSITLEVRASNHVAISLYRRRGFVSHGVRPRYYPDGEDALVLWREPTTAR
jgi:[ribosomal protein S18]-alanine N-acetyltransferase